MSQLSRLLWAPVIASGLILSSNIAYSAPDANTSGEASIGAKQADAGKLTLDRLYVSDDFDSDWFGGTRWLKDGSGYTIIEKSEALDGGRDVVLYNPETGAKKVLISAQQLVPEGSDTPVNVSDFAWSDDGKKALIYTNTKRVWRQNTQGDYWVLNTEDGSFKQVGANFPASSLMFAKFSPDGSRVAYVQKTGRKIHDIYVEDVANGKQTRLTSDGSETTINGTFDWAYEEEFGLRDGFRWSPDGSKIAYWQLDASGVKDFTLINNTDENYPGLTTYSYPKVGETNSAARVGVVSANGGDTVWMNIEGDPRNNYIAFLEWAANSDEVIVQQLNRRQNTNNMILANAESGTATIVKTDQDPAWLDVVTDFRWLNDGKEFLWVSERDGWRQIYRISRDGSSETKITKGDYDVVRINRIDTEGGYIYFNASPDDPQRMYLYRVAIDGSTPAERLTPDTQIGTHSYTVSFDGKWAFHRWSSRNEPLKIDLVRLPDHGQVRSFVDNAKLLATFDAVEKGETEFFDVTTDAGVTMEGIIRYPADFDASKKYPVIVYVYGEPAGMTAADRWSGNNDLWHIMMTQKGYISLTLDNRGQPAPKGRAWRKAIYRTLGLTNVNDQAAALGKLLEARPYLDAERVGIWGHSGGGTSTLHALFRYPDLYKVGVSRAPVPDIRLYDSIYQERYSGVLPYDEEPYERAVAINYAQNLKGKLLLIHGTGDDNVHYQGSERLINKLVEHNKQFDFISYPNRTHGIREGKNTVRHMMTAQTNYFLRHLPAGPRDQ
jgi:dipeptidyl-peptidase-4